MIRKQCHILVAALAVVLAVGITFAATFFPMRYLLEEQRSDYEDRYANHIPIPDAFDYGRFETVLDWVSRYSIYGMPESDALTEAMIEAVLIASGDRYSQYFNDVEYAEYLRGLNGNFYGVGVTVVETPEGEAEIVLVHPRSPIDGHAQLGDVIVAVDGQRLAEVGYEAAIAAIAGEIGTQVTVTVRRGGQELPLVLTRGEVEKQTVISRMTETDGHPVGYVLITGFDRHTYRQFTDAVSALETAGAQAFVFDVRGNGGGLLQEIAKVLAYVLPDGDIAHVHYASADMTDRVIRAEGGTVLGFDDPLVYQEGGHAIDVPMAVLVNGSTASAAELFASAIRDYAAQGRVDAVSIGTKTYGKGTVQSTYQLGESGVKFSVAYYNPPSNVSYDGIGIRPDHLSELPAELQATSILKLNDTNDTQLHAALEVLRARLGS